HGEPGGAREREAEAVREGETDGEPVADAHGERGREGAVADGRGLRLREGARAPPAVALVGEGRVDDRVRARILRHRVRLPDVGHSVSSGPAKGATTEIIPPHAQVHLLVAVANGMPARLVVCDGGAHGATTIGTHGIGVRTPIAAAVAPATCGFAMLWHMPNG